MKERIRKRLYELEKEDAVNKEFWHNHRQRFDQARISTIHGFCNGILKENPVETGLDLLLMLRKKMICRNFWKPISLVL